MEKAKAVDIVLVFAILIMIGVAIEMISNCSGRKSVVETVIVKDTVTRVDTIRVPKTIYVTKLQAKLDTIFVNNNPVQVAKADTTLQKDSSKIDISYFFPPLNYFEAKFDIKEKIIETLKTITETITVTVEKPVYQQWTFWSTIAAVLLLFVVK